MVNENIFQENIECLCFKEDMGIYIHIKFQTNLEIFCGGGVDKSWGGDRTPLHPRSYAPGITRKR